MPGANTRSSAVGAQSIPGCAEAPAHPTGGRAALRSASEARDLEAQPAALRLRDKQHYFPQARPPRASNRSSANSRGPAPDLALDAGDCAGSDSAASGPGRRAQATRGKADAGHLADARHGLQPEASPALRPRHLRGRAGRAAPEREALLPGGRARRGRARAHSALRLSLRATSSRSLASTSGASPVAGKPSSLRAIHAVRRPACLAPVTSHACAATMVT